MKTPFDLSLFNKGALTAKQLEENRSREILFVAYYGWRCALIGDRGDLWIEQELKAENKEIRYWLILPKTIDDLELPSV